MKGGGTLYKFTVNKINDMNYTLISKITNKDNNNDSNEYIVSLHQKRTFIVSRDISSIVEKDLKTKISDIAYNLCEIIEINNKIFVLLITNLKNEGIFQIFDKNNIQSIYKPNENNYLYVLSRNCIIIFKTNKDSNNNIILYAAKRKNKNGILAVNIGIPLNKSFEYFNEIAYL